MSQPYLGQIEAFAFNFAPRGWAMCQGQLMSIQQNAALFALLGTYYGGNGTTTFGLPDLRGRVGVSWGNAPSGTQYAIGEQIGVENVTVLSTEMPAHTHALRAINSGTTPGVQTPGPTVLLASGLDGTTVKTIYAPSSGTPVVLENLGPAGGNIPHPNVMPYLAINYCIALSGIFPSRG